MHRLVDRYPGVESRFINMSQGGMFNKPMALQTVLGSCVSVTFHCPKTKIGGMFHALLPYCDEYGKEDPSVGYKFVDASIRRIVKAILQRGVLQRDIVCKVFGGANAFFREGVKVGERNVTAAFETLSEYPIRVAASNVGGHHGRKILFLTHTGEVYLKMLKENPLITNLPHKS